MTIHALRFVKLHLSKRKSGLCELREERTHPSDGLFKAITIPSCDIRILNSSLTLEVHLILCLDPLDFNRRISRQQLLNQRDAEQHNSGPMTVIYRPMYLPSYLETLDRAGEIREESGWLKSRVGIYLGELSLAAQT